MLCSPPPAPLSDEQGTQTESVTQAGFSFAKPPVITQNVAIRSEFVS